MGAEFDYREYKTLDRKEVERQWNVDTELCRYDNGHSYSGGIGMLRGQIVWLPGLPAESTEAAARTLAERHAKWDPPMAVRFADGWIVGGWCSS